MDDVEFESETNIMFSPGARIVVVSWLPAAALALGVVLGILIGTVAGRGVAAWIRGRHRRDSAGGPPLRLPGESPDVESEL